MNKEINFVLTIDAGYINQATVTMTSVVCNLNKNRQAHFYVFFKGYTKKPQQFIDLENQYNCKITCIDVLQHEETFKNQIESTNKNSWVSIATYYRLLMFKFLPNDVEKAIYIDADMIVECDLSELYDSFNDSNKMFGSVVDIYFQRHWWKHKKYYAEFQEFKKLVSEPNKYGYFCAGFYIANIKMCRELNVFQDLIDFLAKHPNPQFADQDVLNAIFGQKYQQYFVYLDPSYDVPMDASPVPYKRNKYFYSKEQIANAFKNPKVLHYSGAHKPWIDNLIFAGGFKWWEYYHKSPAKMKEIKVRKLRFYRLVRKPF